MCAGGMIHSNTSFQFVCSLLARSAGSICGDSVEYEAHITPKALRQHRVQSPEASLWLVCQENYFFVLKTISSWIKIYFLFWTYPCQKMFTVLVFLLTILSLMPLLNTKVTFSFTSKNIHCFKSKDLLVDKFMALPWRTHEGFLTLT